MLYGRSVSTEALGLVADLQTTPFWLDDARRPEPSRPLQGDATADLVIVGGGFTGLWAALHAIERNPRRDVLLIEGDRIANEATGRNGGFVSASITHGLANGHGRWPDEMPELLRLGNANLDAIEAFIMREGIDCDFVRDGDLTVATQDYQVKMLQDHVELATKYGESATWLDREEMQARVRSSAYLGGVWSQGSTAVVNPARLAWGLADVARRKGVRIAEGTRLVDMQRDGSGMRVRTKTATIHARRVLLATGAGPSPVRTLKHYIAPVYDYVLVTEPLTPQQHADIGWNDFSGVDDAGNQFHYYRRTSDGRILWGGFDAVYHRGNGFGPQHDVDRESFGRLAQHFFATFPQLSGVNFTHGWGGAIDTCSRFAAFWGLAHSGRVSYVAGYTGLGVGTSRFGAEVALDLLDGIDSPATRLSMVRTKPLPFPPEPARSIGIDLMRRALAQADEREGHRNLWLRTMDRLGLGFDS